MRIVTEKVIRDILIDELKDTPFPVALEKGILVKRLADLHETPTSVVERPMNELLQDMNETFIKCHEIARKKNSDYGGDSDPYNNFRNTRIVGVSVQDGIMVRLTDKFSRIATLLKKKAEVSDESIEDTIDDAINYFAILKSTIKRKIQ